MTDSIADMLTRMRNALAVKKSEVLIPVSKIKIKIAKILKENNFISNFKIVKAKPKKANSKKAVFSMIKIYFKYNNGKSVIRNLTRISKPGRRIYVGKDNLPNVLNNRGIAIISTSKGIMTNKEAKNKGLGGELLCEIF